MNNNNPVPSFSPKSSGWESVPEFDDIDEMDGRIPLEFANDNNREVSEDQIEAAVKFLNRRGINLSNKPIVDSRLKVRPIESIDVKSIR